MPEVSPDFVAKLAAIKAEYASESLPAQISDVQMQCDCLCAVATTDGLNAGASALHARAHKLTGSSGTFGFSEISVVSREICNLTERSRIDVTPFSVADRESVILLVEQLQELFKKSTNPEAISEPDDDLVGSSGAGVASSPEPRSDTRSVLPEKGYVVILCQPESPLVAFASTFIAQEFNIIHVVNTDKLPQVVADNNIKVLVAELELDGEHVRGEQVFVNLNADNRHDLSVIFVSSRTDMIARLAAVRAGGDAFIPMPFEESELMDSIDRLVDVGLRAPYRVLIVDRNRDFNQMVSTAMKKAGIICEVVTDPVETLDSLASFVPESILMDISMPGCTGQELANVILQQETFFGTPITFLSEERRREGRIDLVRQGSYGYMAKPVDIDKLIELTQAQAARFRSLRSRMVRDSLTGLNNHSMTRRLLEREIDNARRTSLPLSFVMIDIDHFKNVNDTYGHSTGDQVLRSLSRLLKQRFRSNDVVGRLGGEEFGVVISGTDGETSEKICNEVRIAFSEIEFTSGMSRFSCKFSAGIASFPDCSSSSEIFDAADKALYEAKSSGRNKVVLSRHTS